MISLYVLSAVLMISRTFACRFCLQTTRNLYGEVKFFKGVYLFLSLSLNSVALWTDGQFSTGIWH